MGSSKLLKLYKDYTFSIDGTEVTIPAGFTWNGASIPLVVQPIFGGRYAPENIVPSLIHDYLIFIGWDIDERDLRFYSAVLDSGRGKKRAYAMYTGVRVYSLIFYKWKM